jgi:hypothetical protein
MGASKQVSSRKIILRLVVILVVLALSIQIIRPAFNNPPVTAEIKAPAEVKNILQRACYDCHSNQTKLRWFDKIAPIYWRVTMHVSTGRAVLNFSEWENLSPVEKKTKLWEAVNQIGLGSMPLKDYKFVHPSSNVSPSELAILRNYLAQLGHAGPTDTSRINAAKIQYQDWASHNVKINNLPKALNGISYIPEYKNWQAISTTERFDTGTMRIIFGNDIAVKAAKENNIHPWPKGTIFAKAAWTQVADQQSNIHTGAFLQVAFMIKDSKKYASTGGWGFATFQTPKMIPYGKTALFANECINCHRPLKNADYVFTLPIKQ